MNHHHTCAVRFTTSVPSAVTILLPWLMNHGIESAFIDKQIENENLISYCITAYNFTVYVFYIFKKTGQVRGILHRPGYPEIETRYIGDSLADIISFMKSEMPFYKTSFF